jgi:hypothetical protein
MSTTTNERHAGLRIWLAIDESSRSSAALTAATALAEALDAELAALFVEDVNLQRLFGLPFAREYSMLTGATRPLSRDDIELAWRAEARALQRQLAEAAARQRVRWSFRVARGTVASELSMHARSFDLVVVGRRAGGATLRSVHAFVERRPQPGTGPVLVLFEDMPASAPSLAMAVTLAMRSGADLVLLVSAADGDAYRTACAKAQEAVRKRGSSGRCLWLREVDAANLVQAVREEGAGCLVLADRERFLRQPGFERMVDALECPVVLTA